MLLALTDCGGGGGTKKDEVEHTGDAVYDQCEADSQGKAFDGTEPSYDYEPVGEPTAGAPQPDADADADADAESGEHVASKQEEINGGYKLPGYTSGQPGGGWLVQIGSGSTSSFPFCSGVKIAKDVVLTAAHCLVFDTKKNVRDPSALTFWYRYTNSPSETAHEGYGIVHPKYSVHTTTGGAGARFDYAVIVTSEGSSSKNYGLRFGAFNGFDPVSNEKCTSGAVTSCGWGRHQATAGYPAVPGEVYGGAADIAKCYDHPSDSCTHAKNGGVSTFNTLAINNGDSGGPSIYEGKDGNEYVVGIHSSATFKNGVRIGVSYDGLLKPDIVDWICQGWTVPTNYTGPNKYPDNSYKTLDSCNSRNKPECYTTHK